MGDAADIVRRFSCCTLSNKYMNANKKQMTVQLTGERKRLINALKKSILLK